MKVLLSSLNARYTHSSLALYALQSYAATYSDFSPLAEPDSNRYSTNQIVITEFTVNNSQKYILQQLYEERPDVLCFSCYIWNIEMTLSIVDSIKKIRPELVVVLGGPEVSYDAEDVLRKCRADFVVSGEGEETFVALLSQLKAGAFATLRNTLSKGSQTSFWDMEDYFEGIRGLTYKKGDEILTVPNREAMALSKATFPYQYVSMPDMKHRILYYETSRGCPFGCTYCLSSGSKGVRFLDLSRVCEELGFFLRHKVKQVKLVDRTFNCDKKRAAAIWAYLVDHDNGLTNFHFEIAGDLLDNDSFDILRKARPGFFQFEIGVQSTSCRTLSDIGRISDLEQLFANIRRLKKLQNIHIHLDLIAGLPGEGYDSFARSFDQVYMLEPELLQLGFLKVLKGSVLRTEADRYGIVYTDKPPYEVLHTHAMRYDEVFSLQRMEEMIELFYNSDKFYFTLRYLLRFFSTAFALYKALSHFWEEKGYHLHEASHQKLQLYELMLHFGGRYADTELVRDLLQFDLLRKHNEKSPPPWLVTYHTDEEKRQIRALLHVRGQAKNARIARFEWDIAAFARGEADDIERRMNYIMFLYRNRASEPVSYGPVCRFEPIDLGEGKQSAKYGQPSSDAAGQPLPD